jgi:hypothetical protein
MQRIAHEFLSRVIARCSPGEDPPNWSQLHSMGISFANPKATHVTNTLKHFPIEDWTIRLEWCL